MKDFWNKAGRWLFKMIKKPGTWALLVCAGFLIWTFIAAVRCQLYTTSLCGLYIGIAGMAAALAGYIFYFFKGWLWKLCAGLICLCLCLGCTAVENYMSMISQALVDLSSISSTQSRMGIIYTYSQAPVSSLDDLSGQTVGILSGRNDGTADAMLNVLGEQGITIKTKSYSSLQQLYKALRSQAVRAIILNGSDQTLLGEFVGSDKASKDLSVLYTYPLYTAQTTGYEDVNLETDPFNLLLSVSSTDLDDSQYASTLNVLFTINPSTRTVLVTYIPRTLSQTLSCAESLACPADTTDRVEYSSMYTAEALKQSVGGQLETTIDFLVRTDLDGMLALVDALDTVELSTSGLWASASDDVTVLDSPRIRQQLGTLSDFSQEDSNAEQTQLRLIRAIWNKFSAQPLLHLKSVLSVMEQSISTNMTYSQLSQFVKLFFLSGTTFTTCENQITGTYENQYSAMLTEYAPILIADETSLSNARAAISAVLGGRGAEEVNSLLTAGEEAAQDEQNTEEVTDSGQESDADEQVSQDDSLYGDEEYDAEDWMYEENAG